MHFLSLRQLHALTKQLLGHLPLLTLSNNFKTGQCYIYEFRFTFHEMIR